MKFQHLLLLLFCLNFQFLFSQDLGLSVLTIPDSLSQNANSVVRFYTTNIGMLSHKKMNISITKAVTILNKKGNHNSKIIVYYDPSNKIKKLKIHIYNQFGIKIKDVKTKDIKDYSAADGFSLFNDNRLKYYKHIPTDYPYTIAYEYEIESSNTAFLPRWMPIDSYNQSVQKSSYNFSFPNDITIQKVEKNFKDYLIKKQTSNTSLSYKIEGVKAIKYEELSPSYISLFPSVKLASNKFHLEGVDGQATNWKEFGKWMFDNLISVRMDIPESTKLKVKALVKGKDNPTEKAKIIYDYVQKKTRYVSIQVGIGGWMPMLASDVDRLSYGDCKALTNYTKTLMDAAGVESYYTAVYAGNPKRDIEKNVVSVQGNHVFLYVPSKEKDIWLECTSQTVPFGYQGTFTDGREVLVIKPDGGEIKHTGIYNDKDNFQKTTANYTINSDGNIEADITIKSAGVQYKNHYVLEKKSKRDVEEYYKDDYWSYINNLTIENYHFKNDRDSIIFHENLKVKATNYATFSGDRMLFTINAFNKNTYVPKRYRNRKLPLKIFRGYIDIDTFEVNLPKNYTIEAMPNNILIENKFGKYQISIKKINENKLEYARILFIKKGQYPKSEYKNYRNFRKKIAKYDKTKIVLLKK